MKTMTYIAMLLGGLMALRAGAQNANLEDARRRELDLMNAVSDQERHNSQLRQQLRGIDANGTQQELVNASADAAALRKRLDEARLRRDVMRDKLESARRDAIGRFESSGQFDAARRAVDKAGAEMERLSRPILEKLQQSPDYQEAQAMVDAAAQIGEAMQGFPGVDATAMAKADAAFDQAMERVRGMEDAAISADPAAGEAKKSLKVAQDTLAGMQSEFDKRLADEPGVVSAQLNYDTEDRLYNDVQAKLTAAETRVAALQQGNPAGAGDEVARQLKEGETRLADLNEQLAQAKIARQDAEERANAYAQAPRNDVPMAQGPSIDPGPYYPPVDYTPPVVYDDPWYSPGYAVYPSYGYAPYYGYSYCYPYSYSYYRPYCYSGLYLGFSYYSGWNHHHDDHHGHDGHYGYGYGHYNNYYNDSWRGDRYRGGSSYDMYRSDRYSSGSHSTAWNRNRDASNSLTSARTSTNEAERDYRYRTGAGYSGSSSTLNSSRASDYERSMRERRSVGTDTRTAHVEPSYRSSSTLPPVNSDVKAGSTIARRTDTDTIKRVDSDRERSSRAADEMRRAREASDDAARSRSSDIAKSRAADDAARSRSSDIARSRAADDAARSRSVDDGRNSRAGSGRSSIDSGETRSRGSDTPPARSSSRVESAPRSDGGSSSARSSPRSDAPSSVRSSGSSRSDSGSSRGGGYSGPSSSGGRSDAGGGGSYRSGGSSDGGSRSAGSSGSSRGSSGGGSSGGSSSGGGRRR